MPSVFLALLASLALLIPGIPLDTHATAVSAERLGLAVDESVEHVEDVVLVRYRPTTSLRALGERAGEDLGHGWRRVHVPEGVDALEYVEQLSSDPTVESAELDLLLQAQVSPPFTPNDFGYVAASGNPNKQWHLHVMDLSQAWQTTVGSGAVVAVLDTGVTEGPDGFWHSFVSEYDAVTLSSGPGSAADFDGHGSHVAGSIAQKSGNGMDFCCQNGAGVATEATIMPVDVFAGDDAPVSAIVRGIDWAIGHGADVINLSLGGDGSSVALNEAIERAVNADILIIAASGNTNAPVYYPANHPNVMAVGASTINNTVASYSARGVSLDLVAPGGDNSGPIWQETGGSYEGFTGTSMAAANVSGIAALLRSQYPEASAAQVRNALDCSAKNLGPAGWDADSGFGLVQAGDAITQLAQMVGTGAISCGSGTAGSSKIAAVETASGIWHLYHGSTQVGSFYYGNPGDRGFFGDWDCDGVATPGLYRQSDGYVYLRNSNTQGVADISFFFGNPGDIPLAGDFNGDGCDTVSIYRPSQARFYIINHLGSADGGLGAADYSFLYGNPGDVPFVGDWNGDGVDTPGLRRSVNGFVYLRNHNSQGVADVDFFYGNNGDIVFAGDWDADGDDTIGLYRPSNGTIYLRNTLSTGIANEAFPVGLGMRPASGDF